MRCQFTRDAVWDLEDMTDPLDHPISEEFEIRAFFDGDTAVISPDLADAGELTQGLCSPWQNDYRDLLPLLLGVGSAGLCQCRADGDRIEQRRQRGAEGANRRLRAGRL